MSTPGTMRPRRLSTPAISLDDSGTRVSRSGMNTSWTREIGRPNNCPPITAVTYSATVPSMVSVLVVIVLLPYARLSSLMPSGQACLRRCFPGLGGLFLQRRDQAGTVELGDVIVEAGLPPALDRRRRYQRGQSDDRHRAQIVVGANGLGKLETVHVRHFDVGQHHVEGVARAQRGEALLRVDGDPHLVAGGLQDRRQHVAEERT